MSHDGTTWTISVHRDFEDLLDAWKRRPSMDEVTGVLHVGFSRPPAREFDPFVASYRGRLLVTAAAKFALPDGYTASEGTVGTVGELPIHLGVRGWGYELPEGALPEIVHPTSRRPREVGEVAAWVSDYLKTDPGCANLFQQHGIFDDRSYFEFEAELPWAIRRSMGIFRFNETFSGEKTDPCHIAWASPPWLLARAFDTIEITVRLTNVFVNLQIVTVADLARISLNDLLSTRNFGRKSVNDLLSALRGALQQGPVAVPPYELDYEEFAVFEGPRRRSAARIEFDEDREDFEQQAVVHYSTLIEAIRSSLGRFNEREQEVVLRRMGLGYQSETLQELGERFGVTRERIRQIESKVVRRLIMRETWDDDLTAKLSQLTIDRSMPLPLRGIEGADPWLADMGAEGNALSYILANISKGPASIIEIDGTQYIGVLTQDEWDEAIRGAQSLLESGVDKAWALDDCKALVCALLPSRCGEFREMLWEHAARLAYFVERDGRRILSGFGRGAENYVYAVLASSPRPLHYSEIPALVLASYDRDIDVRRAHNAAAEVGLLFGRGTYGLSQHIPLTEESMTRIAEEAYQAIVEGPVGRQWHTSELVAEIVERDVEGSSQVDKYLLNIALKRINGLRDLGRLVWSLADDAAESDNFRVDIRQAIVAALQQAGAPLSTDDIRKRVLESRGVDKLFQIFPFDPVIRVETGIWGLNDRDLPIKRADQGRFLDALVGLLSDRGSGVHYSEVEQSAALKSWSLSVTAFFSLATTDPRLRVSTGRYLYLSEWGGPRRESLGQAVRSVLLESSQRPLAVGDIADRVAARLKRSVERSVISSQLQAAGATYNPLDGTWSMSSAGTSEAELEPAEEKLMSH